MSDAPVTPVPVTPAYKTSEGWINLATGILGALVAAGFVGSGGQVATIGGIVLSAVATLLHTWSRTTIKTQSMAGAPQ